MSILDALKTFKQERESIDDVAALPQALIMQMAQKGQIPKTDLPMILARKAEIAQTQAQVKALQQQQTGGTPPTLMEKMIAANAQQEAPREMTDVGIASNPVPEMRMAGGGIVAFAEGDLVKEMTDEERAEYIKNNPYLQRSIGLASAPTGFGDFLKKYNPLTAPAAFGESVAGIMRRAANESPEDQAARFRSYSNRREQAANPTQEVAAIPTASQRQATADRNKELAGFDAATALFEKDRAARLAEKANAPATGDKQQTLGGTKSQGTLGAKSTATEQTQTPKEKLFSEYEKMLMDEREAAKGAREEAKWARLMEAGLNIMGGESPYAFANIGKGAAAAAKGYGEDVKSLRAEERDRIKQLASLGAKREELGLEGRKLDITGKHYDDWFKAKMSELGELRGQRQDAKFADLVNKNFATRINALKGQLGRELTDEEMNKIFTDSYSSVSSVVKPPAGANVPTVSAPIPSYNPTDRTFK